MLCGDIMDLYKEILFCLLQEKDIEVTFKGVKFDFNELLENRCYVALNEIKKILANDTIKSEDCLEQIQKIVDTYKSLLIPETYDFSGQNQAFKKGSLV